MEVEVDQTLDVKGESCPMPVLQTKKEIDNIGDGEVLEVLATDPGAESDVQSWADRTGNEFLGLEKEGDVLRLYIRKAA